MSNWLDKIMPSKIRSESKQRTGVPEGLWKKCPKCGAFLYKPELEKNLDVCPKCNHHLRVNARRRLDVFLDEDGREEIASELEPWDRLKFKDSKRYKDRLSQAQKATGEKDALIAMKGTTMGVPLVACSFEFGFRVAPWARWWARNSFRRRMWPWRNVFPWSAFRPAAVRACRKRFCR